MTESLLNPSDPARTIWKPQTSVDGIIPRDPAVYFNGYRGNRGTEFIHRMVTVFDRSQVEAQLEHVRGDYSDRLRDADPQKYQAAVIQSGLDKDWQRFGMGATTTRSLEAFLAAYHGVPVKMWQVQVMENSSGYPIMGFLYERLDSAL